MKIKKLLLFIILSAVVFSSCQDLERTIAVRATNQPPLAVVKIHLAALDGENVITQKSFLRSEVDNNGTLDFIVPAGKNRTIIMLGEDINGMIIYYGSQQVDVYGDKDVQLDIKMADINSLIDLKFNYSKAPLNISWTDLPGVTGYLISYQRNGMNMPALIDSNYQENQFNVYTTINSNGTYYITYKFGMFETQSIIYSIPVISRVDLTITPEDNGQCHSYEKELFIAITDDSDNILTQEIIQYSASDFINNLPITINAIVGLSKKVYILSHTYHITLAQFPPVITDNNAHLFGSDANLIVPPTSTPIPLTVLLRRSIHHEDEDNHYRIYYTSGDTSQTISWDALPFPGVIYHLYGNDGISNSWPEIYTGTGLAFTTSNNPYHVFSLQSEFTFFGNSLMSYRSDVVPVQ